MGIAEMLTTAAAAAGLVATLIQILPCKSLPWTTLARHVGRALNVEVSEKIDRNEAAAARYRIIRFDDEIRHGTKHTQEHFGQILDDIDQYERYCSGHKDFPNSKAIRAVANIKGVYDKCCRENSFI